MVKNQVPFQSFPGIRDGNSSDQHRTFNEDSQLRGFRDERATRERGRHEKMFPFENRHHPGHSPERDPYRSMNQYSNQRQLTENTDYQLSRVNPVNVKEHQIVNEHTADQRSYDQSDVRHRRATRDPQEEFDPEMEAAYQELLAQQHDVVKGRGERRDHLEDDTFHAKKHVNERNTHWDGMQKRKMENNEYMNDSPGPSQLHQIDRLALNKFLD